mmetsp:Transcript_13477/g.40779  ORF Transcript_13477/g.40779 Transcript_13477/m.40779 type:complete len:228 (-) Transcript_13477:81-764(-)
MMRALSPPDATAASGRSGSAGPAASRNSTASNPLPRARKVAPASSYTGTASASPTLMPPAAPGSCSQPMRTSKRLPAMASSASEASTATRRCPAAARRRCDSAAPAAANSASTAAASCCKLSCWPSMRNQESRESSASQAAARSSSVDAHPCCRIARVSSCSLALNSCWSAGENRYCRAYCPTFPAASPRSSRVCSRMSRASAMRVMPSSSSSPASPFASPLPGRSS